MIASFVIAAVVDERIELMEWKTSVVWSMVGVALFQSIVSLIPMVMSIRTLWSIRDTVCNMNTFISNFKNIVV